MSFIAFVSCSPTHGEKHLYFCDYWGTPLIDKDNHPNEYFNQMFSYTNLWNRQMADFGNFAKLEGYTVPVRFKNNILYKFSTSFTGKEDGFYREKFEVLRFHISTGELFRSFVFYVSQEDYEKNHRPSSNDPSWKIPLSQGALEFVDKKPPEKYIKIGFDKSKWQCHEVSYFKYLIYGFGVMLMQILGA